MELGENVAQDEANQQSGLITIETPLGDGVMLLTALDGEEALSRCFLYTIEMFTRAPDDDVRTLLGQPVTVWIKSGAEEDRRPLHGHIRNLRLLNTDRRGYRRWRAEVVPWLWFLTQSVDCRIYQNLSIPEITRAVFDEYGVSHYEIHLHDHYGKQDFCVRYQESALAFVARLLEHVGIFYWFEHHQDRHVLVLADHNGLSAFTQPRQAVIWPRDALLSSRPDIAVIHELEHEFKFHPGHWALKDFDFEMPTKELDARETTTIKNLFMSRFEIFDYPGGYTSTDDGGRLTRVRMEAEETRHYQIQGAGSCPGFDPGKRFMLLPARSTGQDRPIPYFLTEVRHSARDLSHFTTFEEAPTYQNSFVCIPAETPFRLERVTRKPIVQGPQTATVTGPAGENIHTDPYGRVKVRFHWDRRGRRDDGSSCWVRVSQYSAGSHWGALAIPHVGQEVVIGFLEGDPDRPMVIGRVHNGSNMPPLHLPRDKHKTMIRDQGDNRMVMHGAPGQERMSLISPKNINFVAMRSPAKALSAQVIDNISFDDFQDGGSLVELWNVYQQLLKVENQTPAADAKPNPTGFVYAGAPNVGPADTGANIDINSLSENDINSLSVGNTNGWINKDLNTWVKGDLNQEVFGDTHTTSHGTGKNLYKSTVRDTFDTMHEEETTLHNEVTGVHSEETGVHLEITGAHVEATSAHFEWTIGVHYETNIGPHYTLHSPLDASKVWTPTLNKYIKEEDSIKASWKVTSNLISFKAQAAPISPDYPVPSGADLATQLVSTAAMPPAVAGTNDLLVASLMTPAPPMAPGQFELTCAMGDIQAQTRLNIDGGLMISLKAEIGVQVNGKMIQLG